MARRSNLEGSVYQRADGLWVGSVRLGSQRLYRYGKTKSEASRKLQQVIRDHHGGLIRQPTLFTLREWVDSWLEGLSVRPSTLRTYRQALSAIVDEIGEERLDRLSPATLSLVYGRLAKRGVGTRSLYLSHGYLKASLEQAVALEVLARNPMQKVQRPKHVSTVRTYWSIEQAGRFVQACLTTDLRWGPLFAVLTTCGLRISEALALTCDDVDLEHRTMKISKALVWAGHREWHLLPPKTRAGHRIVSLPEAACRALWRVMDSQPTRSDESLFQTSTGRPPSQGHLRRSLLTLCEQAIVPPVNVHGLRHVAAVLALRATGDVHAVQQRLGHSHVSVTMGIYAYATRTDDQVAAAVDALLAPGLPEQA